MSFDNVNYDADNNVEFLFERPVGWSSACLDSTINYYLSCNNNIDLEEEIEQEQYKH